MKIGRKITVSFLMAGLMIAGIAVPVTYITARDIIKRSIFAYLSTTAASRAAHVDTFLETSKEAILQLSKSIVVERFLSTGKKGEDYDRNQGTGTYRLNNTNTHLKRIYDIFVLNKHGIVVASSHGPDVGKDKRNDPYFLGGKKGIFIKDAYISADKKVPTIGFAAPILDKEKNSVLGVVVARASMDRIDRIVGNRTCWTETGEIYILNKHGYMITPSRFVKDTFLTVRGAARPTQEKLNVTEEHWDERHEYHEHPGSPGPHAHTARSGCKPLVYTNYRGVNVLGAHAHISEMPWILVTEIEEKEAMAPLNKLSRVFILIFLFIPLAAWATGRYVAKRITRPIDRLRRGVERVGRGDLDYKVARGEKDEVGELAEAFNRMTEDLKGSVSSISRLSNEIARRKKVEAALRGSEDRFQEVMKNSREWIWETDADGLYTYASPIAEEIFGYTLEEIVGKKHFYDLFHPEDREELKKKAFEIFAKKESFHGFKNRNVHKNGETVWLLTSGTPVLDEKGHLSGYRGVDMDITRREKAEKRLRLLSSVVEQSTEGMALAGLDGGLMFVNKAFASMHGYTPEELRGKNLSVFHSPDQMPFVEAANRQIKKTGEFNGEIWHVRRDGTLFPTWMHNTLLRDATGRPVGLIGILRDITERKKMEQSQRLTQLGQLIADIAHEVNNPLMIISGNTQLALMENAGNEALKKYLGTIFDQAQRAKDIILRVLKYSRPGKAERRRSNINMSVDIAVSLVEHEYAVQGVIIDRKFAQGLLPVFIDEKGIQEVLLTLLTNAFEAMPGGGVIDVSTSHGKGLVKVNIKDTGEGMSKEILERIFEPFFTTKDKGTGLGIPICQTIVKENDGDLKLASAPGKGTTATILLPVYKKEGGQ